MNELQYGQVVKSKAGRDKDKIFVIINIKGEYAYLADGNLRRIEKPKQKKLKHIQPTNHVIYEIKEKLIRDKKVTNVEIRRNLAVYKVNDQS
ncbi:KOW domain-containing RNA-binding protein [Vallitalea sp.]|jgi:ribosomal protein L14E/L6E/L27E|uniref:KOW domain-containing RNA-binding protein n=1 Tax=Vallitalea sp. TaxID=1882829 RepID=UPI0025F556B9|nr:KOW domain-containing RNA-binding protein [Vallitalea sp.]MCT4686298.1 KOW domain-containing RNA-binding protein [Vallitalea sp.]